MIYFNRLPTELTRLIFSYIDSKKDLLQCKLTCRAWIAHADINIYKNVTFKTPYIGKAYGFLETLKHNSHLGSLAKNITFFAHPILKSTSTDEREDKIKELLDILRCIVKNCPNITDINTDLGNQEDFWEILSSEKRKLENIAFNNGKYRYKKDLYDKTVYKYKDTIKTLKYESSVEEHEKVQEELWMKRIKESSIEYLGNFRSLENLTFRTLWFSKFYALDDIIPGNLSSLELQINPLGRIILPEKDAAFLSKNNIAKIEPYYSLRHLSLSLINSCYDEISIIYLMNRFPNLESLTVESVFSIEKHLFMSENIMDDYTNYLAHFKEFYIPNVFVLDNPMSDLFGKLMKKSEANNIVVTEYNAHIMVTDFEEIGTIDMKTKDSGIKSYTINVIVDSLQSVEYLKNIGSHLTELLINNGSSLELSTVLNHCPNLKVLRLQLSTLFLDGTITDDDNKLETLNLFRCCFGSNIFSKLQQYLSNLKTLKINQGSFSTQFFDYDGLDFTNFEFEERGVDVLGLISVFPNLECLEVMHTPLLRYNSTDQINASYVFKTLIFSDNIPSASDSDLAKYISSLSKVTPNLKTLHILNNNLSHGELYVGRKTIDLANIITSFPKLNYLQLEMIKVLSCKPENSNPFIETLFLKNCMVGHPRLYSDLSDCLPNLKTLQVSTKDYDNVPLKKKTLVINMPTTSLQSFIYLFESKHPVPEICLLKLLLTNDNCTERDNERYYCSGVSCHNNDTLLMKECTSEEYNSKLRDSSKFFRVEAKCKEFPTVLRYIRMNKQGRHGFRIVCDAL